MSLVNGTAELIAAVTAGAEAVITARRPADPASIDWAAVVAAAVTGPGSARPVILLRIPGDHGGSGPVALLGEHEGFYSSAIAAVYARGSGVTRLLGPSAHRARGSSQPPRNAELRAAAGRWTGREASDTVAALRSLDPGTVVARVGAEEARPGGDADAIIEAFLGAPGADVVLVIDIAAARFGASIGATVAGMIEQSFELGMSSRAATLAGAQAEVGIVAGLGSTPASGPGSASVPQGAPTLPRSLLRASDVVHARLTDAAVEITNRTALTVDVAIALGDRAGDGEVLAEGEVTLRAGESLTLPSDHPVLSQLEPPMLTMRHWSHGSEAVYEGGRQMILGVQITLHAEHRDPVGPRAFVCRNGLDFLATAAVLAEMLGEQDHETPSLPEPRREAVVSVDHAALFNGFVAALGVGSAVMRGL